MSAVSSRPRVNAVSTTSIEMAVAGCVMLASLVGAVVRTMRDDRDTTSHRSTGRSRVEPPKTAQIQAPLEIEGGLVEAHRGFASARRTGQGTLDSVKLDLLQRLEAVPVACRPEATSHVLERLQNASSQSEVAAVSRDLVDVLRTEHRYVFQQALVVACRDASIDAGFASVHTLGVTDESARVVGIDAGGRALVTEIRIGNGFTPSSIETEVIGVADGSCQQVLDSFDEALKRRGVGADSPKRRGTGGVCDTALAKAFVTKKMAAAQSASSLVVRKNSTRRNAGRATSRQVSSAGRSR